MDLIEKASPNFKGVAIEIRMSFDSTQHHIVLIDRIVKLFEFDFFIEVKSPCILRVRKDLLRCVSQVRDYLASGTILFVISTDFAFR
jgi:hypothetical protein